MPEIEVAPDWEVSHGDDSSRCFPHAFRLGDPPVVRGMTPLSELTALAYPCPEGHKFDDVLLFSPFHRAVIDQSLELTCSPLLTPEGLSSFLDTLEDDRSEPRASLLSLMRHQGLRSLAFHPVLLKFFLDPSCQDVIHALRSEGLSPFIELYPELIDVFPPGLVLPYSTTLVSPAPERVVWMQNAFDEFGPHLPFAIHASDACGAIEPHFLHT